MFQSQSYKTGLEIADISSCDFSKLDSLSNEEVLKRGRGDVSQERLIRFIAEKMGIQRRFFVKPEMNALDLAADALQGLIKKNPEILKDAEFIIYAGISNPMPTVCHAALLSAELGFENASCWDLKSGCSTGVLGLVQALEWFERGAKSGVLVCSETFSKFADPAFLQMSTSTGDGACALYLKRSNAWRVRGVVHGTDARYMKSMYVTGKYPVDIQSYKPADYFFSFSEKPGTLERMAEAWLSSLKQLLDVSKIPGEQITHYVSHQVDGTKNREFARVCGIPDVSIYQNFAQYGNMGCPTVFLNYLETIAKKQIQFKTGDVLIFHAVGGGLSWAGISLQKVEDT